MGGGGELLAAAPVHVIGHKASCVILHDKLYITASRPHSHSKPYSLFAHKSFPHVHFWQVLNYRTDNTQSLLVAGAAADSRHDIIGRLALLCSP